MHVGLVDSELVDGLLLFCCCNLLVCPPDSVVRICIACRRQAHNCNAEAGAATVGCDWQPRSATYTLLAMFVLAIIYINQLFVSIEKRVVHGANRNRLLLCIAVQQTYTLYALRSYAHDASMARVEHQPVKAASRYHEHESNGYGKHRAKSGHVN